MPKRLRRVMLLCICVTACFCMFAIGANAYTTYTYPSMPDDWADLEVTVGTVTMPLERYPSGSTYDGDKRYMTAAEAADYGISVSSDIDLRGYECVSFARYVYTALFYKYPQDATIDTSLAYKYSSSYAYTNMIEEVLGTETLAAGYSASTLKTLFTACQPGAVMRVTGHSMVLMAIFDDGLLIYDANFSSTDQVSVRAYTWQSFVNSFGSKTLEALQMPTYYPGYSYSYSEDSGDDAYVLDTDDAGTYQVYDCTTLNVRNAPSTSGTRVGSLSVGTVVEVLGSYNGWAQIYYNGSLCWVSMDYLKAYTVEVSVTFDANGGTASYTSATYTAGSAFGSMPAATKTNRTLLNWTDGSTSYTESSIVPAVSSLALKAQWCVLTYTDVSEDAWYADYVESAYLAGLISADTLFNPDENATRAQMVTVLGREYERETGTTISNSGSTAFTDVSASMYYAKYVAWGVSTGLVKGMSSTTFEPDTDVTREQIAVFLYRMAIYMGYTKSQDADLTVLDGFNDKAKVSDYAEEAICWAVEAGILQGDDNNNINPGESARRSEMITMFSRYISYAEEMEEYLATTTEITFDANGGTVSTSSITCTIGEAIGTLPTPTKTDRTFLGWYDGDTLYTASSIAPENDITLTALWGIMNYTDVTEDSWYAAYVESACVYGLLDGEGTFNGNSSASRSDVVTYMGRAYEALSGTEISGSTSTVFTDVDTTADYAKYVAWGYANGLVMGVSSTSFAPDDDTTRQQIALFLYRLAKYIGAAGDYETDTSVLDQFQDGDAVDSYYEEALCWAVSAGIFGGDDLGRLNPLGTTTRAELVTMMIRFINYAESN